MKNHSTSFIERSNNIHKNKYEYSEIIYTNNKTKVKIFCKKCQSFFMCTPHNHLKGRGCPKCKIINSRMTNEEFIQKANQIHNYKYEYSITNYTHSKNGVDIICPIHGTFNQIANNHLNGQGCPQCKIDKLVMTNEEFIQRAKQVHNNFYDYSEVKYNGWNEKVIIICPVHGKFKQKANIHLRGHGCSKCKQSGPEKIIEKYLKEHLIKFIPQMKFDKCRGKKRPLPFDFYLPEFNTCIEYDGEQHFKPIFGKEDDFTQRKFNDQIKTLFCQNNQIKLTRISFKQKNLINFILDNLFQKTLASSNRSR